MASTSGRSLAGVIGKIQSLRRRVLKASGAAGKATRRRLFSSRRATKRTDGVRMLKKQQYKSFRLHAKIRPYQPPLMQLRDLTRTTLRIIRINWKLYAKILLVFLVASAVLVRGLQQTLNVKELQDTLNDLQTGAGGRALVAVSVFGLVASNSGSGAEANSGIYQTIIVLITLLAVMWATRQAFNGVKIRARDAFYKGMYPLIPFLLVVAVVSLQLIPLAIGGWLYQIMIVGGLATLLAEKAIWICIILLLATFSGYMVVSSSFALVIVTLHDMTPLRALRSARQLVLHRRWVILRRILGFLVITLVLLAIPMLVAIIWLPAIAEWLFFFLSSVYVIVPIVFNYALYLELLHEQDH